MRQNDINFINIWNRFRIVSQTIKDMKCMNNNCLKTPPMDNTLSHLFYTNVKTIMHNKNVFQNTLCETFTYIACDVHTKTCQVSHFKLPNLPFQIISLHYKILVKNKMSLELCAGNYETSDGLMNVVDGIFEDFTKIISKYFVWIHFHNPHIRHNT